MLDRWFPLNLLGLLRGERLGVELGRRLGLVIALRYMTCYVYVCVYIYIYIYTHIHIYCNNLYVYCLLYDMYTLYVLCIIIHYRL